jgi:hypothetical protein
MIAALLGVALVGLAGLSGAFTYLFFGAYWDRWRNRDD